MNTIKIEEIGSFLVTSLIATTDVNTKATDIENKMPKIFDWLTGLIKWTIKTQSYEMPATYFNLTDEFTSNSTNIFIIYLTYFLG